MTWVESSAAWLLNKLVSRKRFDDTVLYACYLAVRHSALAKTRKAERDFYRHILGSQLNLIFDIGANGGAKTAIFSKLAQRVICVEPSTSVIANLRERFAYNERVTIVAKAVGNCEGAASLYVLDDSHAYDTLSAKWVGRLDGSSPWRPKKEITRTINIAMTTLDSLIKVYGTPAYLKIDVEGFELEVIEGLSKPIPLISVECHLPEFEEETSKIIDHLSKLSPRTIYNFTVSEPPIQFHSSEWLAADEMRRVVQGGKFGFMEIYCLGCAGALRGSLALKVEMHPE